MIFAPMNDYCSCLYSVMQSDGNSLKIDAFSEATTSELMIKS